MTTYVVNTSPLAVNQNFTYSQNLNPTGYGIQGLKTTTMGVGGGIGDAAVDVTYSTKPDSQTLNTLNYGTGSYSTSSYEFSPVGVENVGLTTTGGNAVVNTTGNVMGFGAGGDSAIDVTYSTKPDNGVGLTTGALTTTTTTTATTGNVMGFGAGGDNALMLLILQSQIME